MRDGALVRLVNAPHPQVHNIELLQTEIAQIVVDCRGDVFWRKGGPPRAIGRAHRSHLRDNDQLFGIRMEGLLDQLIGDVRPVKVTCIDMIDSEFNGFTQHREAVINVTGWPKNALARQLHGAVAHAVNRKGAAGKRKGAT